MSNREFDQHVSSLPVCYSLSSQAGFDLLGSNCRGLDDSPAWILHGSTNASCDLLSRDIQTCEVNPGRNQHKRQLPQTTHASPHSCPRTPIDVQMKTSARANIHTPGVLPTGAAIIGRLNEESIIGKKYPVRSTMGLDSR